jgi:hypothetical protein
MTNKITRETRDEGQQAIMPFLDNILERVYEAVNGSESGMTAEEVDAATGVGLNNARSRCTEHLNSGRFVVIGKRSNKAGNRNIAVYSVPKRTT